MTHWANSTIGQHAIHSSLPSEILTSLTINDAREKMDCPVSRLGMQM